MPAVKIERVVDDELARVLPEPAEFRGQKVELVLLEGKKPPTSDPQWTRSLGLYEGKVTMTGDLDAPLPDDLQRLFEGEGDEL